VRLDEPVDPAEEGLADQHRVEEAPGRHGPVAQHDEVLRGEVSSIRAIKVVTVSRNQCRCASTA
jgi:hypothetical protein